MADKNYPKNYTPKTAEEKKAEVDSLYENIKQGIKDMWTSGRYAEYLKFMASFHDYSLNNSFLIMLQNPNASMVASFNDWEQKGRSIKAGEKGIKILVPTPFSYVDLADGKRVFKDQYTVEIKAKIKAGELEEHQRMSFKIGTTFDVSQTQGKELPTLTKPLQGGEHLSEALEAMKAVIEAEGIQISYKDLGETKGQYIRDENRIELNSTNSIAQNVKTLTHEYAHHTLHKNYANDQILPMPLNLAKALTEHLEKNFPDVTMREVGLIGRAKEAKNATDIIALVPEGSMAKVPVLDQSFKVGEKEYSITFLSDAQWKDLSEHVKYTNGFDRSRQETEAESVAYIVSHNMGLDTSEYSFGYLAGWSKDKTGAQLERAAKAIKETSREIIQKFEPAITKALKKETETVVEITTQTIERAV